MRRPGVHSTALMRALLVLLLVLTACQASASGPCAETAIELEVSVTAEQMTPSALEACRDVELTLAVESDIDGELHIHGVADGVDAELTTGETATLTFTPTVAGQFIVEVHPTGGEEFEAGVLTVNEP
jgi:hypothetical protein